MNLLHHHGNQDAGFPDLQADRRALKDEIGRLRRQVHHVEDDLAHVTRERDHWRHVADKRRWWR